MLSFILHLPSSSLPIVIYNLFHFHFHFLFIISFPLSLSFINSHPLSFILSLSHLRLLPFSLALIYFLL